MTIAHMIEFYEPLDRGKQDAGWDGSIMCTNRLAILPRLTHYNIFTSPMVTAVVEPFLDGADGARALKIAKPGSIGASPDTVNIVCLHQHANTVSTARPPPPAATGGPSEECTR